jgi:glycosyltransferase involved in cell wall biosynthesis
MALIEVIVPVYNAQAYLARCLNGLLRQDFSDYTITLVDDGSTDNSGALCDEYAARFPERISVIHKKNGGPAEARNAAVTLSTAPWIVFADADDYVSERYLASLWETQNRFQADMVIAPACKEYPCPDGRTDRRPPPVMQAMVMNTNQALEELCYETYFSSFPYGKLIPCAVARATPFPPGRYFEDSFTAYRQILACQRIAYTPEITYFYMQNSGSIQRHRFEDRHQDILDAAAEIQAVFAQAHMPQALVDAAAYKMCRSCYITLFHAADLDRQDYVRVRQQVMPLFASVYPTVLRLKRPSLREKLLLTLAYGMGGLFYGLAKGQSRKQNPTV